jgi:hypothetical protein
MIRLVVLKLSIALLKCMQAISRMLRLRTWIALAVANAVIAVVSLGAYQAKSVSETEIPPVDIAKFQLVRAPSSELVYPWQTSSSVLGSGTMANGCTSYAIVYAAARGHYTWGSPRTVSAKVVALQIAPSDSPYLFSRAQRTLMLSSTLLGLLNTVASMFFGWMLYRKNKADAVLRNLQIEKLRHEIAVLRAQAEQAQQTLVKSGIIIVPG